MTYSFAYGRCINPQLRQCRMVSGITPQGGIGHQQECAWRKVAQIMNEKIEAFYPLLGQKFYDLLPGFSEAWLRFESLDDVWSTSSFYKTIDNKIRYKNEGLEEVEKLLCGMRQAFIDSKLEPFSQAVFHLRESGKFAIDFGYEDVSDFGLSGERRAVWMEKTFGKGAQIQWL